MIRFICMILLSVGILACGESKVGNSDVVPSPTPVTSADKGKAAAVKFGCTVCHSAGTDVRIGPGWGGIFGKAQDTTAGSKVADEAFLKNKINSPSSVTISGTWNGKMPARLSGMTDQDVDDIVAYIKSLS